MRYILLITFSLWVAVQSKCTKEQVAEKNFCSSCAQAFSCASEAADPVKGITCDLTLGQTCQVFSVGAVREVACTTDNQECNSICGPQTVGACDKKDETLIIFCKNGTISGSLQCPDGLVCDKGMRCGPKPDPPTPGGPCKTPGLILNQIVPFPPNCNKYGMCTAADAKPAFSSECSSDKQYFDPVVGQCVAAPYVPCRGVTGQGKFPHLADSKKFLLCDGSKIVHEFTCATATPVYSTKTKACGTEATEAFAPLASCVMPAPGPTPTPTPTPTPKPTKCTPSERQPDPDDKCHKYMICRADGKWIHGATCPAGRAFDPTTQVCVDHTLVPGC